MSWYEVIDGSSTLGQGDIIPGCELMQPVPVQLESPDYEDVSGVKVEFVTADVVIMTQSCDLENDNVENVVLCPIQTIAKFALAESRLRGDLRKESLKHGSDMALVLDDWGPDGELAPRDEEVIVDLIYNTKSVNSYFDNIAKGRLPGYLLLPPHRGQPKMFHSVASFRQIFVQPKAVLEKHARHPRLRLISPYREHLAQSFANYFMRVGLPIPAMSRG